MTPWTDLPLLSLLHTSTGNTATGLANRWRSASSAFPTSRRSLSGQHSIRPFGIKDAIDLGVGEYKLGSIIRTYLVQYSNAY